MPGPEAETIELSVFSGQSARPSMTFTVGTPAPPVSVGTAGQWNVMAEGVGPIHVYIAFDGASVFAAAAAQDLDTLLAGSFIGTEWVKATPPCELRFGGACLILQKKGGTATTATTSDAPRAPGFWHEEHTVHDGGALWQAAQRARAAANPSGASAPNAPGASPGAASGVAPNVAPGVSGGGASAGALQYPPVRPAAGMPPTGLPLNAAPPILHPSTIPPRNSALGATTPLIDAPRFRDMPIEGAGARAPSNAPPARPFESPPETVRGPRPGDAARPGSIPPAAPPPGDPLAATIYGPPQRVAAQNAQEGQPGQGGRSPFGSSPPHAGPSPFGAHPSSPPGASGAEQAAQAAPSNFGSSPPQASPQGAQVASSAQRTVPPQRLAQEGTASPEAAKKDEKPGYWKSASNVKKATILLMPFVLVLSFFMLQDEEEGPPAKVLGTGTGASAKHAADASASRADVDASRAEDASPAIEAGALAQNGESPASDASAQIAIAPAIDAGAQATNATSRDAGAKVAALPAGKRTPERLALDSVAAGSYAEAAKLYDALALAHPDDPTFKEAARILREKASKPE